MCVFVFACLCVCAHNCICIFAYYFYESIEPVSLRERPMNSALFISLSVCNAFFSGLAHYVFLICDMMLGFNKVWDPSFAKNSSFAQIWVNGPKFGPKINFPELFFKSV